ncbi:uncharacterized protein LOC105181260 [Harpegnathos saltator]|uniref:Apolipophorin-3 n=1 Tax=Harpegnathos saltator TaxID=610380 RepID=E2BCC2_HARSA|nr:uncharacterized protein LOC105181260 [Harpegnathos saltator]EFN86658.1 hypothetical protein EAI_03691 [Harpegnathos saltator]
MRCILAVIFTVVLIATDGKAMPASDVENQQTTAQPLDLEDYVRKAQNTINALGTQLQEQLNQAMSNQGGYFDTLKEQSKNLVNNMLHVADKIHTQGYTQNMNEEVRSTSSHI